MSDLYFNILNNYHYLRVSCHDKSFYKKIDFINFLAYTVYLGFGLLNSYYIHIEHLCRRGFLSQITHDTIRMGHPMSYKNINEECFQYFCLLVRKVSSVYYNRPSVDIQRSKPNFVCCKRWHRTRSIIISIRDNWAIAGKKRRRR